METRLSKQKIKPTPQYSVVQTGRRFQLPPPFALSSAASLALTSDSPIFPGRSSCGVVGA